MTDKEFKVVVTTLVFVAMVLFTVVFFTCELNNVGGGGKDPSTNPPPPDTLSQTLPIAGSFLLTKAILKSIQNAGA